MKYKRAERRKFIRFDLDTNVRFRFLQNIDEYLKGKAKNLSAEGVCIVTEKTIPIDKDVELAISLPGRKSPIRIRGKVVWTHRIKGVSKKIPDHYEAGIELYMLDRDDEVTLLKYYCEQMIDNLSQHLHI